MLIADKANRDLQLYATAGPPLKLGKPPVQNSAALSADHPIDSRPQDSPAQSVNVDLVRLFRAKWKSSLGLLSCLKQP